MTKKRIGIKSKHVNEARPLGTPSPKKLRLVSRSEPLPLIGFVTADELLDEPESENDDASFDENDTAETALESQNDDAETFEKESLDSETAVPVVSLSDSQTAILPTTTGAMIMQLTLKTLSKKGTEAIYGGLNSTVRIRVNAFPNKVPPQTLDISGEFAGPKEAKPKMTAEERKAARAAAPKLTAAEKVAKMEARLAKAKAKLAEPVPA